MSARPGMKKHPSAAQRAWLRRGLDQAGGKLPLFDEAGRLIAPRTIRACIAQGWAEPWFVNPLKPDWLVCKLTELGRAGLGDGLEFNAKKILKGIVIPINFYRS
jgi:hypothetical protein